MKKILVLLLLFTMNLGCTSSSKDINLVAIGDSLTYGTGDPEKKGYIERVRVGLEEEEGVPVHLVNYAVPGYTTANLLKQLKNRKMRQQIKRANAIILYIGTNDFRKSAQYVFQPLDFKKMNEGEAKFSSNLHQILKKIRAENSRAPILVLGLYHPYVEFSNEREIREVVEGWNAEIAAVAQDFDETYFVSTLDLFEDKAKQQYFSDSLHPNAAGYELIAERVLDTFTTKKGL
jgi:lysophospholipase L1-like esterase